MSNFLILVLAISSELSIKIHINKIRLLRCCPCVSFLNSFFTKTTTSKRFKFIWLCPTNTGGCMYAWCTLSHAPVWVIVYICNSSANEISVYNQICIWELAFNQRKAYSFVKIDAQKHRTLVSESNKRYWESKMHNNCWKNHFIIRTMGHLKWYDNVGFLHVNSRLINWHSEKFHAYSASNVQWQCTFGSTKWAERQCIFLLFFILIMNGIPLFFTWSSWAMAVESSANWK